MMMLMYALITGLLIAIDQITKHLLYGKSFSVIGNFLWVESTGLNTGAAGGMLAGCKWLFIVLAALGIVVCIYFIISKRYSNSFYFKLSVCIILGGIVGNLIDRILLGGVRDFIYFKSINFYVFNIADVCLTVGTIMVCVYILFMHDSAPLKREKVKKTKEFGCDESAE